MLRSLERGQCRRLPGKTVLLVDVSGSMDAPLSRRAEMRRNDAAYGLAVLLREIAEQVSIYTFSDKLVRVPSRQGFALRDALHASQPHGGTYLGRALGEIDEKYDRLIVITDEQSHDAVPEPQGAWLRDQRGQLPERRGLWQVGAHRWLERFDDRVHPRGRAGAGITSHPTGDLRNEVAFFAKQFTQICADCRRSKSDQRYLRDQKGFQSCNSAASRLLLP